MAAESILTINYYLLTTIMDYYVISIGTISLSSYNITSGIPIILSILAHISLSMHDLIIILNLFDFMAILSISLRPSLSRLTTSMKEIYNLLWQYSALHFPNSYCYFLAIHN
jgi:hypothetical protein